jgi:50S ribosomal protein L16 3-hydroxylase
VTTNVLPTHRAPLPVNGSLPEAVWAYFAQHAWEHHPVVIPGWENGPLLSPEELLATVSVASQQFQAGDPRAQFTLWVAREIVPVDICLLPKTEDRTLDSYLQRVEQTLNGREFTILLANPHLFDSRLYASARCFLRGLHEQAGIACGGVDTGVFLGRYDKTPFGIHRGQMSVMTFPTVGQKSFRLWSRGYGEKHIDIQDSLEYPNHIAESIAITASPGDLLYWPADYWHIAETSPGYTATWNIGFWWDRPSLGRVLYRLSEILTSKTQLVAECFALDSSLATGAPNGTALPKSTHNALVGLREAVAAPTLERLLVLDWLATTSADGFRNVPALLELDRVPMDLSVRPLIFDGVACVRTAPLLGGELAIAANGHLLLASSTQELEEALATLIPGEPISAKLRSFPDLLVFLFRSGCLISPIPDS